MTSEPPNIPLADGGHLQITDTELRVVAQRSDDPLRVPLSEITSVSRGGKDIIVTRQEADPLSLVAATLDDARRFDAILENLLPPERRQRPRRWLS